MFCVDNALVPIAEVAGRHIAAAESGFDVVVCVSERTIVPAWAQAGPLRYVQLATPDWMMDLPQCETVTWATYLRLLLPEALGTDYERILYLDADIWVRRPDLNALLMADMPRPIAAAPDLLAFVSGPIVDAGVYVNAGVLLMDCSDNRAAGMMSRVLEHLRQERGKHPGSSHSDVNDQTAFNTVLGHEICHLAPRWNFMHDHRLVPHLARTDPAIIHFIAKPKPWERSDVPERAEYAELYRRGLASLPTDRLAGLASGPVERSPGMWLARDEDPDTKKGALSRWNRKRKQRRAVARLLRHFAECADIR